MTDKWKPKKTHPWKQSFRLNRPENPKEDEGESRKCLLNLEHSKNSCIRKNQK